MTNRLVVLILSLTTLSGCMAIVETWAIRTVDDIQKSEYHAEANSAQPVDLVSRCMMQTLYGHKTAEGKRPYADVALREFGTTHEITLRTPQRPAAGIYDVGGELLFLIENSTVETGGTRSSTWVHQNMPFHSPQEDLDALLNVVKICL